MMGKARGKEEEEGVYNEIWGGVEVSPLSNFKYSRWRPRLLPRRKFLLFRFFLPQISHVLANMHVLGSTDGVDRV